MGQKVINLKGSPDVFISTVDDFLPVGLKQCNTDRGSVRCIYGFGKEGHVFILGLVSLFNSISTFVSYLMPNPSFKKNSSCAI